MRKILALLALAAPLAACGAPVTRYEASVRDFEPLYCYRTIGGIQCHEAPKFRDERQMVNYFGPAPVRYDRPETPEAVVFAPPPAIEHAVRDPEPIPEPVIKGKVAMRSAADGRTEPVPAAAPAIPVETPN